VCEILILSEGIIRDCVTISIAMQQRRTVIQHLLHYLSTI